MKQRLLVSATAILAFGLLTLPLRGQSVNGRHGHIRNHAVDLIDSGGTQEPARRCEQSDAETGHIQQVMQRFGNPAIVVYQRNRLLCS